MLGWQGIENDGEEVAGDLKRFNDVSYAGKGIDFLAWIDHAFMHVTHHRHSMFFLFLLSWQIPFVTLIEFYTTISFTLVISILLESIFIFYYIF